MAAPTQAAGWEDMLVAPQLLPLFLGLFSLFPVSRKKDIGRGEETLETWGETTRGRERSLGQADPRVATALSVGEELLFLLS